MIGWLVSLATFPGTIVHEFAHKFFCDVSGVRVQKVCYFRFGNPAGYVLHQKPNTVRQAFLISVGPMIINSLLCMLISFLPMYTYMKTGEFSYYGVLMWLGTSIGMHAFPSNQDIASFVEHVRLERGRGFMLFSSKVLLVLVQIVNLLSFFWADLLYAIFIASLLPLLALYFL